VERTDNGNPLYNERFPFILSSFEPEARLPPEFSQHSHEILGRLLEYSDEEIADLAAAGVVE
jgi:crotonobetainyl-CoA:carnitine CoA-transferase CaiB-like acyl-CoA transferase